MLLEEIWSGAVKAKKHPPEGLFAEGTPDEIKAWLKKSHKDNADAIKSLNFYINRAGKNLSSDRKAVLDHVKKSLEVK